MAEIKKSSAEAQMRIAARPVKVRLYSTNNKPTLGAQASAVLRRLPSVALVGLALGASGCVQQTLPKDAQMKDVGPELSTPWGKHVLKIKEISTGKAAQPAK